MVERFSGEWKTVKLGEVGKWEAGTTPSRSNPAYWMNGKIFWVTNGDLNDYVITTTLEKITQKALNETGLKLKKQGSIVIGMYGTIGTLALLDMPAAINQNCCACEVFDGFSNRFIFYALMYHRGQLKAIASHGAVPHLSKQLLINYTISVPPLEEQHAIADTLSAFDRHISALSALIAKHEAIRQGALEDLMTGRTRLEGFCGSWKTVNFEDVITPKARIGWQGLRKDEYLRSGYGYLISGTDFHDGTISLANIWQVSKARYDMDRNIQVTEGDVLVTKDGTIGKVAIVPKLSKPATLNSHVYVFRTKPSLNQKFLYYVLLSKTFRAFIDNLKSGSIIVSLPQKDLKLFRFMMPPLDEQLAISSVLSALDSNISSLKAEHSKLSAIRSAAINDLLSGKIRLTL